MYVHEVGFSELSKIVGKPKAKEKFPLFKSPIISEM